MSESHENLIKAVRHCQESLDKYTENRNDTKLLHYLERLCKLPIKVVHLEQTGVGRTVNGLRKLGGDVGDSAKGLVAKWKEMVVGEQEEEEEDDDDDEDDEEEDGYQTGDEQSDSDEKDDQEEKIKVTSSSHRKSDSHRNDDKVKKSRDSSSKSSSHSSDSRSKERERHHKHNGHSKHKSSHKRKSESSNSEDESHRKRLRKSEEEERRLRKSEEEERRLRKSEEEERRLRKSEEEERRLRKSEEEERHKSKKRIDSDEEEVRNKEKKHKSDKQKKPREEETSKPKEKHKETTPKEKEKHKSKKDDSKRHEHSSKTKEGEKKTKDKDKHKEKSDDKKVKKSKSLNGNQAIRGIDSGSGASFAEALGMCEPSSSKNVSKKKTEKKDKPIKGDELVPKLLKEPTIEPIDINISSLLPPITPNYRPLGNLVASDAHSKKYMSESETLQNIITSKNQRTKVYSGNKTGNGKVPSLFELCTRILQDNIDALEYTGGVPYNILKPILEKANPNQLYMMEHHNPYLVEDTDELWQLHCQKEFRNKRREEMETWREMYLRCLDERDAKLKALTANIKQSQDKSLPVRMTKLAYVETVAKPPRNIARKQAKNGTAFDIRKPAPTTSAKLSSLAIAGEAGKVAVPNPGSRAVDRSSGHAAAKAKKAPLMLKSITSFKNRFKR